MFENANPISTPKQKFHYSQFSQVLILFMRSFSLKGSLLLYLHRGKYNYYKC